MKTSTSTLAVAGLMLALLLPSLRAADEADNARARADAAHKAYDLVSARLRQGAGATDAEEIYRWSRRWMEAEQELAAKPEDRVAAAEAHRKRMADLADFTRKLVQRGAAGAEDTASAEFYRLEAEWDVARARAK